MFINYSEVAFEKVVLKFVTQTDHVGALTFINLQKENWFLAANKDLKVSNGLYVKVTSAFSSRAELASSLCETLKRIRIDTASDGTLWT